MAECEQPFPADKLFEAMKTAVGRGWVELRNREPLKLVSTGNIPLDFTSGAWIAQYPCCRRSEASHRRHVKWHKAAACIGLGRNFETLRRHDTGPLPKTDRKPPSPAPPPVITTVNSVQIDRCAFKVASGPNPKGCLAIQSDIGVLEVDRCWFEGFDSAIEVAADFRTNVRIRQTMIVRLQSEIQPKFNQAKVTVGA